MRKWLLVGITLLVMAMAFGVVILSQRQIAVVAAGRAPTPAPRQAAATTQFGSISQTEMAYVYSFDKRTGLPLARFRGAHFTPHEGDQLVVDKPEVEFFLRKDRSEVVRIVGKTGMVTIPGEGPRIRSNLQTTPMEAPTRGDMTDVVVTHYPTQEDAQSNKPDLTLTLAKAYFDSELFEISTEDYVAANGKTIPAKDAPVTVRGDVFDFDGKGLTLRWDEGNQRLKSLVVYQGIQLVIKRPGQLGHSTGNASRGTDLGTVRLAAADAPAAAAVLAAQTASDSRIGQIYRAVFHDRVKMTQEEQTLATAHEMKVDFTEPEGGGVPGAPETAKVASTATADAAGPAKGGPGATKDATKEAKAAGTPQKQGMDAMGIKPDKPIVIRWGGQLTVGLAPEEPLRPESPTDAILHFAGTDDEPAIVYDGKGGRLEASFIAYEVEKEMAWVEGTPGHDIRMFVDTAGSVLMTPQLRYSHQNGKATLTGPSSAYLVTDENGRKRAVKATWKDSARATFVSGEGPEAITHLLLRGQVHVEQEPTSDQGHSARIKRFEAGALALVFGDPVATGGKRQVKQVKAAEGVDCTLVDEKDREQNIRANNLQLGMAQNDKGDSYPVRLDASGDVVAGDGLEQIKAQTIGADLDTPSSATDGKQPDDAKQVGPKLAGLRRLVATGAVELTRMKDNAVNERARCERLEVRQNKDKSSYVLLEGTPASVLQGQTLLSGPFIEMDMATQRAVVTGGGRMVTSDAQVAGGAKGWPMEITWTGPGELDGKKNLASVAGKVVVKYSDADGTANEAAAERVEIVLADKLKETEPAKETDQTKPRTRASEIGFMSAKYAQQVTLLPKEGQDVRLQSLRPGPGGTIERQINLLAMRLDCFLSKDGVQRIEVPATADHPGRFLYISQVAMRKPAKTGDPLNDTQTAGATAFAWREKMTYDRAARQINMTGDVMVRHEPRMVGAKPFTVDAQSIQVDLADGAKKQAGTPVEAMEVKRIVIKGTPVHLTREDVDMTAPEVEIDPAADMVYARGTPDSLVQVDKGRMLGSFELVEMNTKTNEMKFTRGQATGRK